MRKGKVYLHMQNLKATLLRSIQNWIHCTRFPQRWPRIKETEASAPGNVFACFTWLGLQSKRCCYGRFTSLIWRKIWMETIIFGKYVKFTKHCKTPWRLRVHLPVMDVQCTVGWIACVFLKCLCKAPEGQRVGLLSWSCGFGMVKTKGVW